MADMYIEEDTSKGTWYLFSDEWLEITEADGGMGWELYSLTINKDTKKGDPYISIRAVNWLHLV
jgi:hypothetical protein